MDEVEKNLKFLTDCAEISEKIKLNPLLKQTTITVHVDSINYPYLLGEVEEFVKMRVDKSNPTISIMINDVEFLFVKS